MKFVSEFQFSLYQVEQLTAALFTEAQERVSALAKQLDFEQRAHLNTTRQLELITMALQETRTLLSAEQSQVDELKRIVREQCGDTSESVADQEISDEKTSVKIQRTTTIDVASSSGSSVMTLATFQTRHQEESSADYAVNQIFIHELI